MVDRAALFATPITTLAEAKAWITALSEMDKMFHLEDDPDGTIDIRTGAATFTPDEVPLVRARVAEIYSFDWAEHECPLGYHLDVTEPGWRNR